MAMATIEGLREWFFNNPNPTAWRLYRGAVGSKNHDGGSAKSDTADQAWEKLASHLENESWEPGEYVTIRVYSNGNLNGGGSDITYRPVAKNSYHSQRQSAIAGIGEDPKVYIAQQVQKEIQIYDLNRQVQDLTEQLEAKQNIGERIINTIVEHPSFDPNALLNGIGTLISNFLPKKSSVGVAGFNDPSPQGMSSAGDQAERIAAALNRLQAHFPEMPIEQLLENLADFVDQNPTVAKNVLKNILE